MEYLSPATTLKPSTPLLLKILAPKTIPKSLINVSKTISRNGRIYKNCTSLSRPPAFVSRKEAEFETEEEYDSTEEYEEQYESEIEALKFEENGPPRGSRQRERRRYRKQYPGEVNGITEEMRFVTMKLRNGGKRKSEDDSARAGAGSDAGELGIKRKEDEGLENNGGKDESWEPSMEGFLKYLVDSKLVFDTIEHIVDESSDVSYVYFRKTGLERSNGLSKDLEWLRLQGNLIPQPSNPGTVYARYLEELAEKSRPLFLSHFYNIYFSHIAGGQMIAKQVSERLLEGRELEFYRWEGDAEELLRGVREKLNALGEHWSRDEKNKCLREATKTFRFLGQIVRLIIL
ncbi:probable inactive heme oxygenase 2, chloroplastic [Henckelia pumila]|uniref:probable inactive heme oxygenase 2, chloroplastic n=1 Tax=Henckelia pumila TaxID=405737 RepID=UPI003C6DD5B6